MRDIALIIVLSIGSFGVNGNQAGESKVDLIGQKLWHEDDPAAYLYSLIGKGEMWFLVESNELAEPELFLHVIKKCQSKLKPSSRLDQDIHRGISKCMVEHGFELKSFK